MSNTVSRSCLCFALGLPLACGAATNGLDDTDLAPAGPRPGLVENDPGTFEASPAPVTFPGAGTSGAALPLEPGIGPETTGDCSPEPSATTPSAASVQPVCFYAEGEPNVPAATIEQVVEVVGNAEWVHVRLILNPSFVDNSFGSTAIGWGTDAPAAAAAPPAAPLRGMAPAPPAGPQRDKPVKGMKNGSHTFRDLVGSDHAEMQLLAGDGEVVLHFKLDYLSESPNVPSGYASLGVTGGEGEVFVGDPAWVLGSSTSMDRNLNACGLDSFVTDSPSTDDSYAANTAAPDWDYRVIYEVWVAAEAFGAAGFGSALIESVHASPSKTGENTETVLPAPCPQDPTTPDAPPAPLPTVLREIR